MFKACMGCIYVQVENTIAGGYFGVRGGTSSEVGIGEWNTVSWSERSLGDVLHGTTHSLVRAKAAGPKPVQPGLQKVSLPVSLDNENQNGICCRTSGVMHLQPVDFKFRPPPAATKPASTAATVLVPASGLLYAQPESRPVPTLAQRGRGEALSSIQATKSSCTMHKKSSARFTSKTAPNASEKVLLDSLASSSRPGARQAAIRSHTPQTLRRLNPSFRGLYDTEESYPGQTRLLHLAPGLGLVGGHLRSAGLD